MHCKKPKQIMGAQHLAYNIIKTKSFIVDGLAAK